MECFFLFQDKHLERISPELDFFKELDKKVVDTSGYEAIDSDPEPAGDKVLIPGKTYSLNNQVIVFSSVPLELHPHRIYRIGWNIFSSPYRGL